MIKILEIFALVWLTLILSGVIFTFILYCYFEFKHDRYFKNKFKFMVQMFGLEKDNETSDNASDKNGTIQ